MARRGERGQIPDLRVFYEIPVFLPLKRHYCHTVHIKGPSLRNLGAEEHDLMDDACNQEEHIVRSWRHIAKRRAR